jgi:hypothetical protein
VGTGARLAAIAILFGTSSIARAKSFERYDTPLLALLAAPPPTVSGDGGDNRDHRSRDTGSPPWLRLSLDGPLPKTGRPIRTSLLPPGGSAPPAVAAPVPSPVEVANPEALPAVSAAAGAETVTPSPNALLEWPNAHELRQIRVSLDHTSLGLLGHAERDLPRPIRLFLGSEAPSSSEPRPFRNALD